MDDKGFLEHKQKRLEELVQIITHVEEERPWLKQK